MNKKLIVSFATILCFTGCATQRDELKTWWASVGRANTIKTGELIAAEVQSIVEKDVFANATDATDSVLKQFNVQGFSEAGHTLEAALPSLAIAQIPDFVLKLRQIWLPGQTHYTNMAADLGKLIQARIAAVEAQTGHKVTSDQANQIVEAVIQGLSTAEPAAAKGP